MTHTSSGGNSSLSSLLNIEPEQRARIYGSTAEALIWLTILAWFLAMTWAFSLFPQTTPLADSLIQGSLRVLTTIVVTGLFNRILDVVIARIASVWEHQGAANSEERARLLLRIPTIAKAVSGFKTFALVFIAILAILGEIGVPIGSVVTIGGLAAIALSLAAQNFVRDFVNGSLVLFEDQYVVGDYVTINAASGIVEHLSLRMVQIRDSRGDLVTIPHSSVTAVINQSRNWSRVDYRIPIAPEGDVPKAIELVRQSIEELARESEWRGAVTLPIEWIGVDRISKDYALVRASVRTAPLRQFAFRRAVNASVLAALVEAKIALGAHPDESVGDTSSWRRSSSTAQCNLCNGSMRFIIANDPAGHFRFASLQSPQAAAALARVGWSAKGLDSIVLIDGDRAYRRSDAALRIAAELARAVGPRARPPRDSGRDSRRHLRLGRKAPLRSFRATRTLRAPRPRPRRPLPRRERAPRHHARADPSDTRRPYAHRSSRFARAYRNAGTADRRVDTRKTDR